MKNTSSSIKINGSERALRSSKWTRLNWIVGEEKVGSSFGGMNSSCRTHITDGNSLSATAVHRTRWGINVRWRGARRKRPRSRVLTKMGTFACGDHEHAP